MGEIDFDIKAMLDTILLAGLAKNNDIESKQALAIMKIFQKHNIGTMKATEILLEISCVLGMARFDNE